VVATLRQYTRGIGKNLGMSVELVMAEEQCRIDSSGPRAGASDCGTGTA
jgi:1,4-dihydroxy-2-naphthoyl-CoA synthase